MECGVLYRYNAKLESKGISRRKHKGDAYWMRRSYVGYNEVFLTGIRPNKLGLLKKDWGEIGEKKLKSGKKQAILRFLVHFAGIFEYTLRPLTPSFVGSNPATPARKGKFGQKRAQICSFFAF